MRASRPQSLVTYLMLTTPSQASKGSSSHVLGITLLTPIMDRFERVETKVDLMDETLSLVEESCSSIRGVVERIDVRIGETLKYGKVSVFISLYCRY